MFRTVNPVTIGASMLARRAAPPKNVRFGGLVLSDGTPIREPAKPVDPFNKVHYGLVGIKATAQGVSFIEPEISSLIIRGYPIDQLAEKRTFEDVAHLLIEGELPATQGELQAFEDTLKAQRGIPKAIVKKLAQPAKSNELMMALAGAVLDLPRFDEKAAMLVDQNSPEAHREIAVRLTAQMPTIIAAAYRAGKGLKPIPPNPTLGHAANFIYMLTGKKPDADLARMLDRAMILYSEHEMNCSTTTVRDVISSGSNMYFAIAAGVGALAGPLHGGANKAAVEMLDTIGPVENLMPWLEQQFAQDKNFKVMGMGHRVYTKDDPRAVVGKQMLKALGEKSGDSRYFHMVDKLEQIFVHHQMTADEQKRYPHLWAKALKRDLYPNVDLPLGPLFKLMGLPVDVDVPIFAQSRVTGQAGHVLDYKSNPNNRITRPASDYTGPGKRPVPVLAV